MRTVSRRAMLTGLTIAACTFASTSPAMAGGPGPSFRVFVAGDSTAATYPAAEKPQSDWGQALPIFHTSEVQVINRAINGRSSKSFVDEGHLDRILDDIRPGDYLLVSFGHNDQKDDPARHTDPFTTYQDYLRKYIDGARTRGATPVLVTSVERRRFDSEGNATTSHGDYPEAMRQLGAEANVPLVDLTAMSLRRWDALGVEATKDYFLWLKPGESENFPDGAEDDTHFQAHGAIEVARLVAKALAADRIVPPATFTRLDQEIPDDALIWPPTRDASGGF